MHRSTHSSIDNSFYKIDMFTSPPLKLKFVRLYIKFLAFFSQKRVQNYLIKLFATPRISRDGIENLYENLELERFGATSMINIREHEIFLYQEGKPEVILVYGWESSLNRMETVMQKLRENNIGFVAFDLPAHGKSSGSKNHAILSADIVSDILKMFPSITKIIGHSFGGGVSYLALEQPSNVTKLITIGAPTQYSTVVTPFFMMLDLPENLQLSFLQGLSEYVGNDFSKYDLTELTTASPINHLLIHDKNDATIPYNDALRVYESHPDTCELMITEGLGHRKIMHNLAVIDKMIGFIKE